MKQLRSVIALLLALSVLLAALPIFASAAQEDEDISALLLKNADIGSLQAEITPSGDGSARQTKRIRFTSTTLDCPPSMYQLAVAQGKPFTIGLDVSVDFYDDEYAFAWIMEIYKDSIAEKNYVNGGSDYLPDEHGDWSLYISCDTKDPENKLPMTPGKYIAAYALMVIPRNGEEPFLYPDVEKIEFEVAAQERPLERLTFSPDYNVGGDETSSSYEIYRGEAHGTYIFNVGFVPQNTTTDRWTAIHSTDESIAAITWVKCGSFRLDIVAPGDCQIIAMAGGKTAALNIHAVRYADSIQISEKELHLHAGDTHQLICTLDPADCADVPEWSVRNWSQNIVKVDQSGLVTVADFGIKNAPYDPSVGYVTEVVTVASRHAGERSCKVYVTPHEYTDWEEISTLSCTTPAAMHRVCIVCGKEEVQILQEALGHDWDKGVVISGGSVSVDPGDLPIGMLPPGPVFDDEDEEPQDTVTRYTCTRCGATRQKITPLPFTCTGDESCPSAAFTDVKGGSWYHEAVDFAVTRGLFNGTSDTTFSPNKPMQRGMLVTVLHRLEGSPAPAAPAAFEDVKEGQYYAEAVAWANENGIVTGVADGSFNPRGNVTREQLATILYRYASYRGLDIYAANDLSTFPDAAKVGSYALKPMRWAVAEELISGTPVNGAETLSPKGSATRAQVAIILMRFVRNVVGVDPLS